MPNTISLPDQYGDLVTFHPKELDSTDKVEEVARKLGHASADALREVVSNINKTSAAPAPKQAAERN